MTDSENLEAHLAKFQGKTTHLINHSLILAYITVWLHPACVSLLGLDRF